MDISEAVEYLNSLVKLWEGLEGQKSWHQNHPKVMEILEVAITSVRGEVQRVAKAAAKKPRKSKAKK